MQSLNNPNYACQLTNWGAGGDVVVGALPEHFSLRVNSHWEPTLANTFQQGTLGNINALLSVTGYQGFDKILTGQIWRGSEPLAFDITLQFDAESDASNDVTQPVSKLISWASPQRFGSYVIRAPGPTIFNQDARISLRIGRFLFFDSVVLPTVDVTWIVAPDSSGQFIAAEVQMSVVTFYTPDRDDIREFFGLGAGGANGDSAQVYDPQGDVQSRVNRAKSYFGS